MKKSENIEVITFDVGNTLLQAYPSVGHVMSDVLQRFGWEIPPHYLDAHMGVFDRYYTQEYEKDESFWADEKRQRQMWVNGFSEICRAVGVDRDVSEISWACYDEFDFSARWRLFDGVEETLAELVDRGYRLGVISNWGAGLSQLLDDVGIGKYFEVIIASAAAGFHKPQPQAFYLTLDQFGVTPQQAVHVGDHMSADVEGARTVGMHPVLIRYEGVMDPTAGNVVDGVPVITHLPQLLELV